ncbi:hypothetical protein EV702DRAFT_1040895 [Suillus placidus]|uniref:Uncharacterized protein n=1 Tax=Suillus placidus TaxID=48579 RepID=A0A9P7D8P9_9AGAM|nr:hypothetical protein EV702DRAFT_1040895 [Suillus placidus]
MSSSTLGLPTGKSGSGGGLNVNLQESRRSVYGTETHKTAYEAAVQKHNKDMVHKTHKTVAQEQDDNVDASDTSAGDGSVEVCRHFSNNDRAMRVQKLHVGILIYNGVNDFNHRTYQATLLAPQQYIIAEAHIELIERLYKMQSRNQHQKINRVHIVIEKHGKERWCWPSIYDEDGAGEKDSIGPASMMMMMVQNEHLEKV